MTRILALCLGIVLGMAGCVSTGLRPIEGRVHDLTLYVEFLDGGHCSATKIGPHDILLAAHCLSEGMPAVLIGNAPVDVVAIKAGPADHARVTLGTTFTRWAQIGPRPRQGDEVFIFGNPAHHRDQLRRGYISGMRDDGLIVAMLPIWKGDSGSAVFNERGQIVAIVVQFDVNAYYTPAILQPLDGA